MSDVFVRRLIAALCALPLLSAPLAAQEELADTTGGPTVRATHGDWQILCTTNEALVEECFMGQEITESESGRRAMTAMVFKAPENVTVMRLMVPLGVLLLAGVNVAIDGASVGDVAYIACFPDGCMTEVNLDAEVLGKLKAGNEAVVTVYDLGERPVPMPISLSGFTAGLDAL